MAQVDLFLIISAALSAPNQLKLKDKLFSFTACKNSLRIKRTH